MSPQDETPAAAQSGVRGLIPDEKGFVDFSRFSHAMNSERGREARRHGRRGNLRRHQHGASRFAILFDKDRSEVAARVRANQGHIGRCAELINDEVAHRRCAYVDV